jgi:hypothetical protein
LWAFVAANKFRRFKMGPKNQRLRFSLAEFEKSDHGKQLGDRLSVALREAELHA